MIKALTLILKNKEELDVKIIVLALITGLVMGFIFALLKLPIPAPPALPGIMGIVGIYLGFKLFEWVSTSFFHG